MSSESNAILIYDIPGRDGKTWSHHVLRILFAVHYKGIPYSIEGVEYPDITATFAPTTLEPKNDPLEPYEIPVLKFQTSAGSPKYCMNAVEIIEALEEIKPEPSLLYTSARSVEFRSRFGPAFVPVLQLAVGHVPQILSERSIESFVQKRRDRWGKPIEQWIAEHPVKDGLALAKPRFEEFGDWLEQTPGPFVNGEQPGYADFAVASFLGFVQAVGLKEAFESLLAMHPAIHRLYYAVKLTQLGNDRCGGIFEAPV